MKPCFASADPQATGQSLPRPGMQSAHEFSGDRVGVGGGIISIADRLSTERSPNAEAARATRLLPLKHNPSSNRPYPTCCTSRAAPVVSVCQLLISIYGIASLSMTTAARASSLSWARISGVRTFGRLTSGTTTVLTALGASLGSADRSPPG